jgi:hypothetical protein
LRLIPNSNYRYYLNKYRKNYKKHKVKNYKKWIMK